VQHNAPSLVGGWVGGWVGVISFDMQVRSGEGCTWLVLPTALPEVAIQGVSLLGRQRAPALCCCAPVVISTCPACWGVGMTSSVAGVCVFWVVQLLHDGSVEQKGGGLQQLGILLLPCGPSGLQVTSGCVPW